MSILDLIKRRKSIRAYRATPVEPAKLAQILEAGRLAPSANNRQSWKFVLVTDKALLAAMVPACRDQEFVGQAPAAILVCTDETRLMTCRQPAGTINCAIALSYMQLQATELGLGTCWLGAFNPDAVAGVLDLPPELTIVAISPIGYPAEDPLPKERKALEEILIRK